jgi:hypothetical protein
MAVTDAHPNETARLRSIDSDEDAPALSGVHRRPRGVTGIMMRASGTNPTWLLVALLLGGGGGSAIGANVFSDGDGRKALDKATAIETRLESLQNEQSRQAATSVALSDEQKALERRMERNHVRTLQWIASVLSKQSQAIGAIAKAQGVDVDVSVPPLLPASQDPWSESQ